MTVHNMVLAVVIMALVTYIPRALPLTVIKRKLKSPFLKSFLYYIPYAVLAAMTFPAVFSSTGNPVTAIAGCVGAVLMAFFNLGLLPASIAAVLFAYVAQLLQ